MSQCRFWRIKRGQNNFMAAPFQFEHFRVAKSLRENGITRVEVTEAHAVAAARQPRVSYRRGYAAKSRKALVFARIHLKIQDERFGRIRLDDLRFEFHVNRIVAKKRVFI